MKKFMAFLLLLPLLLPLFGCWHEPNPARTASETQSTTTPSSTAPTEEGVSAAQACRIIPTAFSLEEYEQYLDRFVELSPDFIHYNVLKEYGEFVDFKDITYALWENYIVYRDGRIEGITDQYIYNLLDPNGYTITISVTPATKKAVYLASPKLLGNTQALHTASKENGQYKYNDLYYSFYDGHLSTILLQYKESVISIHRPDYAPFSEYPVETNTFIAKLLNTETADAAIAEFLNRIEAVKAETAKAMVGYPMIEDLQEYTHFIETQYTQPEDFITYDTLKELGEFVSFTYYPYIDGKYYKYSVHDQDFAETDARYRYLLKTPGGDRIVIKVYSVNILNSTTVKDLPADTAPTWDMSRLPSAEGLYRYEDIYYYYVGGWLAQVHWRKGDYIIKLIPWENDFEKYRNTNAGMLSDLLTLATAKPAVAAFNAQTDQALAKRQTKD